MWKASSLQHLMVSWQRYVNGMHYQPDLLVSALFVRKVAFLLLLEGSCWSTLQKEALNYCLDIAHSVCNWLVGLPFANTEWLSDRPLFALWNIMLRVPEVSIFGLDQLCILLRRVSVLDLLWSKSETMTEKGIQTMRSLSIGEMIMRWYGLCAHFQLEGGLSWANQSSSEQISSCSFRTDYSTSTRKKIQREWCPVGHYVSVRLILMKKIGFDSWQAILLIELFHLK